MAIDNPYRDENAFGGAEAAYRGAKGQSDKAQQGLSTKQRKAYRATAEYKQLDAAAKQARTNMYQYDPKRATQQEFSAKKGPMDREFYMEAPQYMEAMGGKTYIGGSEAQYNDLVNSYKRQRDQYDTKESAAYGNQLQSRGSQMEALNNWRNAAAGTAPSVAVQAMQAGGDAAMRSNLALGSAGRGGSGAGLRTALQRNAEMQAQNVQATGMARAQEMTDARAGFSNAASGMRGQDLGDMQYQGGQKNAMMSGQTQVQMNQAQNDTQYRNELSDLAEFIKTGRRQDKAANRQNTQGWVGIGAGIAGAAGQAAVTPWAGKG